MRIVEIVSADNILLDKSMDMDFWKNFPITRTSTFILDNIYDYIQNSGLPKIETISIPFDSWSMEHQYSGNLARGEITDIACFFTKKEVNLSTYKWGLNFLLVAKFQGSKSPIAVGEGYLHVNSKGYIKEQNFTLFSAMGSLDLGPRPQDLVEPFVLGLAFIGTKNTKIINVDSPTPKNPYTNKGKRLKQIKYFILDIKPFETKVKINKNISLFSTKDSIQPLHWRRGHFKNYLENGLFGKYKGRFWYGPYIAGDAKNGVNIKDYNIESPIQD